MLNKRTIRKPDLLFVLTLLTGVGVFISTTAEASDPIFSNINLFKNAQLDDMMDGDVQVTGNQVTGLHLSAESQARSARYVGQHDGKMANDTGVHLSWKLSW